MRAGYLAWGIVFALAGTVALGFRPVFIKLAYAAAQPAGVSATTLLFLRMALTLPFFAAMALWSREAPPIVRRDWLGIVALGFIGYYAASLLDFMGLQYVSAGVGRLILFLYPTLVIALSAVFLAKRPSPRELAALVMTYAGIALVVSRQVDIDPANDRYLYGVGLIFTASMCYAIYLVSGSALVQRVGSARFTGYTMMVSTVPAVLQFAVLEDAGSLNLAPAAWLYVVLLATVCTALPVFLVAEALKRIGANHFALIGALGPVTAVAADFLLLEGTLGLAQLAGSALVISGVLLVSLKRS